ncbi:MAG: DUF4136 domain-containing protein [Terracidiphilus sp.]
MRLTMLLRLVLTFPVTTALAYGQEVHYNYDRAANFSAYKTYQWVETPVATVKRGATKESKPGAPVTFAVPPGLPDPPTILLGAVPNPPTASEIPDNPSEDQLINNEIKRAIDEQLAQKGLIKVEKNADLHVSYHAAIRQEQSLYLSGMGWGERGWGGWGSGSGTWNGSMQAQTSSVPIGTIVVDLYDPTLDDLIWRGDATKTIDLKKDPDKNYKNLQKAMAKLLKNYPPPQPKK